MIRIERLVRGLESIYRDLLLRDPRTQVYPSLEFANFLQRAADGDANCLLAFAGQELVGALPFFTKEAPGIGKVINSLPWYGSHGGCTVAGPYGDAARLALLSEFRQIVAAPDVLSATMVLTPFEERYLADYQRVLKPATTDGRIGQMTSLPADGEDIAGALERVLHQKTRNLVRKALKQGFVVIEGDEDSAWRFLFETHVENMQAVEGKSKPWDHFQALRETIPTDMRQLLIAEFDGAPVAALLLLYFNKTVEYVTPVIKHDCRSRQPLSCLIWHGMLDAIKRGYAWWNWGGTWLTQTSLHHFKAGWGAVDMPYSYLVCASSEGKAMLAQHKSDLGSLFPFYYTYPYDQLT